MVSLAVTLFANCCEFILSSLLLLPLRSRYCFCDPDLSLAQGPVARVRALYWPGGFDLGLLFPTDVVSLGVPDRPASFCGVTVPLAGALCSWSGRG